MEPPQVHRDDHVARLDRHLPWLVTIGLICIAVLLWRSNGVQLFGEMLGAAWAYCF